MLNTRATPSQVPFDLFKNLLDSNPQLGYRVMANIAKIAAKGLAQMNRQFSHFTQVLDMYANNRIKSMSDDAAVGVENQC
jgi:hypothetical protein